MSNFLTVLTAYPRLAPITAIHPLGGAGGFSGARFWRVGTLRGDFCLRRWPPEYPREEDLAFIHAVLRHVSHAGFAAAAVPIANSSGKTHLDHSGYLWEVAPWMPGQADFNERPTELRLAAAMQCLAQFHQATEGFAEMSSRPPQPSPAVGRRRQILREWLTGRTRELEQALTRNPDWPEMTPRVEKLLRLFPQWAPFVDEALAPFTEMPVRLQPCIRDVWHDHLLFTGDMVTGLIDFGSMGLESVACDVARLLGSLAGSSPRLWRVGMDAYCRIRGLSSVELGLVPALDASAVLLGALNWAAWVMLEKRGFEDPLAVLRRMDLLIGRLEATPPFSPTGRGIQL